MQGTRQFERYLRLMRLRLKQLTTARASAILAAAALAVTLLAVATAVRTGFPADVFIVARVVLLVALIGLSVRFAVLPNRRIEAGGAREIEQRVPAFGGRVETWLEMRDTVNPMREILADPNAPTPQRVKALATLVNGRDEKAVPLLHNILAEADLRGPLQTQSIVRAATPRVMQMSERCAANWVLKKFER